MAAALVTCIGYAKGSRDSYSIDNFEGPKSLSSWRISGEGSLELGAGYRGRGAVLHYRVRRDAPVLVMYQGTLQVPKLRDPVISLWARFPANVQVTLQGEDSAGNKVLLPVEATLEHPHAEQWRYASSRLKHQITGISLSIQTQAVATVEGQLDFDELTVRASDKIVRFSPAEQNC